MAFPLIPVIGATIGTAIISNIKEQYDIDKAKKEGTKLAADKYAPVLKGLEKECEKIKKYKSEDLIRLKNRIDEKKKDYENLLIKQDELIRKIKKLETGLEGEWYGFEGDASIDYMDAMESPIGMSYVEMAQKDATLLSILFYNRSKVYAAEIDAYLMAKVEWEKKIAKLKGKIDEIINSFSLKEQQILEVDCSIEAEIIVMQVEIRRLEDILVAMMEGQK